MTTKPPPHLMPRCQPIRMLLLDVDGVLTDGRLIYGPQGEELKEFHVRDGLGIRLAMAGGITVGIVTGRGGAVLARRCRDLGIELVFDKVRDKAAVLHQITTEQHTPPEQIAFMGDDLIDLPLLTRVGLPIAVADAHPLVIRAATWTTQAPGGCGAVREVCEGLLHAQQKWDGVIGKYTR